MKFRAVFVIFNLFLVFFLAMLIVSPIYLFGPELAYVFWLNNWFLILIPALLLVFFDIYFFINRRLYAMLEKENWPDLVDYLEKLVFQKGKYKAKLVKLLANTYLVLPDAQAVINLEKKTALAKPSLLDKYALIFGAARLLCRDTPGALKFFEDRLPRAKGGLRPWIRWYYGFTLFLNKQYESSLDELVSLAKESPNRIVKGLCAYFLQGSAVMIFPERTEELKAVVAEARKKVRKAYPKLKTWLKKTGKLNTEIHAAVMAKYLEETGRWLYSNII